METNDLSDLVRSLDDVPVNKSTIFAQISEKLAEKNELAKRARSRILTYENSLAQAKDELRQIEEEEMPALLDELGVSSVTLNTGATIQLDTSLHVSILAQNKEGAFSWLREKGLDIVKNELTIKFNKGEENMVGDITSRAEELGLAYDKKETIHPMTLKSTVKEQQKLGVVFPASLFDIFIKRSVNTK